MPKIRLARPEDLPQILFIERLSFPTPWSPLLFWAEFKKKGAYFWVLEDEGQILGYLCFWFWAKEAHLVNIAVRPERRREGWASLMMRWFLRFVKRKGAQKVYLEVRESNLAAQKLYRKFGFRIDGRRKAYYSDTKEDALLMSLDLS